MNRNGLIIGIVAALTLIALGLMLRSLHQRSNTPPTVAAAQPTQAAPRYVIQGLEWTRLDERGQPILKATAKEARYYDDKSGQFDQIHLHHLGSKNGPWTALAPAGILLPDHHRIQLTQAVTLSGRLKDGAMIDVTASGLWVDAERKEIYTDAQVELDGPGRHAKAQGLRATWDSTRVELLKNVEVQYVLPAKH